jgi:hypothetical protein
MTHEFEKAFMNEYDSQEGGISHRSSNSLFQKCKVVESNSKDEYFDIIKVKK